MKHSLLNNIIISILLSVALCFAFVNSTFAYTINNRIIANSAQQTQLGDNPEIVDGFQYEVNANGISVTITKYVGESLEVNIPSRIGNYEVTALGKDIFNGYNGKKILGITIPASVTNIWEGAHYGLGLCDSLINIEVDANNPKYTSVEGVLFNKEKTELIHYPQSRMGVTYTIPNGIETIAQCAFENCRTVNIVNMPSSLRKIGWMAFGKCKNLTSVSMNSELHEIGMYAFEDCAKLANVVIPQSVKILGAFAFNNCASLTAITIPDGISQIEQWTFAGCGFESITIPKGITYMSSCAFNNCSHLTNFIVDESNESYSTIDGVLTNKYQTELIKYPEGRTSANYNVPEGISMLSGDAFINCNLKTIKLPYTITTTYATSGGTGEFYKCTNLEKIYVDEKNENYSDIDGVLFNKDRTKIIRYPEGRKDLNFVLPLGIKEIDFCAFINNKHLANIIIADGTEKIDNNAFDGCSNLEYITIPSSVTSIADNILKDCKKVLIVCQSNSTAETFAKDKMIPYTTDTNISTIIKGDANNDNKITATDLMILKHKLTGLIGIFDNDIEILDFNNDGNLGPTDLLLLKRKVVGL